MVSAARRQPGRSRTAGVLNTPVKYAFLSLTANTRYLLPGSERLYRHASIPEFTAIPHHLRSRTASGLTRSVKREIHRMIRFYFHPSPNPAKVALFLEEAKLPYEVIPVDTSRGEQHLPAFRAINPNGKVPAIVD